MKNTGQKLYSQAKKYILNGNMLLSKKPELTLPNLWPAYFSKSKKITVWDLDGKKYTDMICFVGQNILGYANKSIDKFVFDNAAKGNMTSLNCPEEVLLAKKLIKLHPWADISKFARSGGEANAMSIRIARAASKRDHIAVCGYHGWHDWYLSVNLSGKNRLKDFLLPGLQPDGVPKNLRNTVHPFNYGDMEKLIKINKKYKLAAIKMEVARSSLPDQSFLKKVRKFATKNKIILIFDECTSGFRRNLGGLHMTQKVYPDICMLGKALGNGYAITAVIGKKSIMNKAKSSFISSTFWSERIGFLAAIKTLEVMKKTKSWEKLIKNGKYLNNKVRELALKHKIELDIGGIESIFYFSFKSKENLKYKTFLSQEMLKKGYLASNITFLTIFHNKKIIDKYIKDLDPVFKKISFFEKKKDIISKYLKVPVCHTTFKRLTD